MAPLPTPNAPQTAVSRRPVAARAPYAGAARARPQALPFAGATLDALLDALRTERRLLEELATTMRRQRAAVGADDLPAVDDSVFATHRILATLGQARVRRRQINRLLAGVDDLPARELDAVLGDQMTDAIRVARAELQESAGELAGEVEMNRRVLRQALAAGDAQARSLVGAPAESPNGAWYAAPAAPVPAPAGGVLLDRTA